MRKRGMRINEYPHRRPEPPEHDQPQWRTLRDRGRRPGRVIGAGYFDQESDVEQSYSARHGRQPPISTKALVELVFRMLRKFEERHYFAAALGSGLHGAPADIRIDQPAEYIIAHLARPGIWKWLGNLDRVIEHEDFPDWDEDTLLDVIELYHNRIVARPQRDRFGTVTGYDRKAAQDEFRAEINQILALRSPPLRLAEDGTASELPLSEPSPSTQPGPSATDFDVFISYARSDASPVARHL
jgi:hypothetical protein